MIERLAVAIFIAALLLGWSGAAIAGEDAQQSARENAQVQDPGFSPGAERQLEAMLARSRQKIAKERADCAAKLGMEGAADDADNMSGLIARYGAEKAKAFNDCVIDESGVFWSIGRAYLNRNSVR